MPSHVLSKITPCDSFYLIPTLSTRKLQLLNFKSMEGRKEMVESQREHSSVDHEFCSFSSALLYCLHINEVAKSHVFKGCREETGDSKAMKWERLRAGTDSRDLTRLCEERNCPGAASGLTHHLQLFPGPDSVPPIWPLLWTTDATTAYYTQWRLCSLSCLSM